MKTVSVCLSCLLLHYIILVHSLLLVEQDRTGIKPVQSQLHQFPRVHFYMTQADPELPWNNLRLIKPSNGGGSCGPLLQTFIISDLSGDGESV